MKRTKHIAILVLLALLVTMFAACGSSSETSEESSETTEVTAAEETEAEEAEEAVEEEAEAEEETEEAEEIPEESAEEAVEAEEAADEETEETEETASISYPLGSDITITFWTEFDNNAFGSFGLESYNDLEALSLVAEATGVNYEYVEVSNVVASEQFNLMIASGDWCDAMKAEKYYTGGLAQALSDEVIYDLSDLIPEYAPDYYAVLSEQDQTTLDSIRTDGKDLQLVSINSVYINDGGTFVRGDYLDELGVEWSTDFEDFIDLLYLVKNTYGSEYTYPADPGGGLTGAEAYFETELFSLRSDSSDLAVFVTDGVVYSGAISDGYRAYLELARQLYADGIFNQDFYVAELDRGSTMSYIGDGNIFIWTGRADSMNDPLSYTTDEDMYVQPVDAYFLGESGEYDFLDEVVMASTEGISITTACEDPGLVLSFYNYFYTDEGALLCNFGIEDVAYSLNADGEPEYTDLILNNPDGMNFNTAMAIYGMSGVVNWTDTEAKLAAYTDEVVEAIELFSNLDNKSSLHTYPNGAALSAEESSSINNQLTAVTSYAAEQCLKFLVGAEDLTDETWETYVQHCIDLGINDCLEVYQTAYDDYLAR